MRTIQIGIEVHKAIEAERTSLDEPENSILLRLLKLKSHDEPARLEQSSVGRAWSKDGVELPQGTKLRAVYSGQTIEGVIEEGRWLVEGLAYESPSMALVHNVTTAEGNKTTLNGWNHWSVKRPNDASYQRISHLRALAGR